MNHETYSQISTELSDYRRSYCKTRIVRMPFISRISRPWRVRENNGSRYSRIYIFYRQSISSASKSTKIKGAKIIHWT